MSHYAWFKLLVRAIGLLLMGMSIPTLIQLFIQLGISWDGWSPVATGMSMQQRLLWSMPSLMAYGAQAAFGYYLLFRGESLIRSILQNVEDRCAVCGYELEGLKGSACPECNSPIRAAKKEEECTPTESS